MTLADRLDALLTRPIYDCDLETIREAAKRLRALETGSGAMTDIVERARIKSGMLQMGERIAFGSDAAMINELADEITRLRTERSELIEALSAISAHVFVDDVIDRQMILDKCAILSKIKEQKA